MAIAAIELPGLWKSIFIVPLGKTRSNRDAALPTGVARGPVFGQWLKLPYGTTSATKSVL